MMPDLIKVLVLVISMGSGFVLFAHLSKSRSISLSLGLQDLSGLRPVSTMYGQLRYGSNLSYAGSTLSLIEDLVGWNQSTNIKSKMTPTERLGENLGTVSSPAAPEVKEPIKNSDKIEQSPLCADRGQGRVDAITYNQRHSPALRSYAAPLTSGRGYVDGGTAQGKQSQQASIADGGRVHRLDLFSASDY